MNLSRGNANFYDKMTREIFLCCEVTHMIFIFFVYADNREVVLRYRVSTMNNIFLYSAYGAMATSSTQKLGSIFRYEMCTQLGRSGNFV